MSACRTHKTMSIEEAIRHAEERGQSDCSSCATEHKQLATWLNELVDLRERYANLRKRCVYLRKHCVN